MQNSITSRQNRVLDHLFAGDSEQIACLEEKVPDKTYQDWWKQEAWCRQFAARVESCRRQAQLILCNFAPFAAAKLVGLASSEKEEIARHACLDILEVKGVLLFDTAVENTFGETTKLVDFLGQERTAAILKILAEGCEKPANETQCDK